MGGPRKEFFTQILQQIELEYFKPVREWSSDYEIIGKIFGKLNIEYNCKKFVFL